MRRWALFSIGACAVGACSGGGSAPAGSAGNAGSGGASGSGGSGGSVALDDAGTGSGGASTGGNTASGGSGGSVSTNPQPNAKCAYTDDASFCACMSWSCGGITVKDSGGTLHTVYCGACGIDQYCQHTDEWGTGVGTCGGKTPLAYEWQRQKIEMLVAMAENDTTVPAYDYAQDIHDGRGYTIGKVGFSSGTGDFIVVAECYNLAKADNVLAKYWGHRDAAGQAVDGLIHYEDLFFNTQTNQGETTLIDSLAGSGTFIGDIASAAGVPRSGPVRTRWPMRITCPLPRSMRRNRASRGR